MSDRLTVKFWKTDREEGTEHIEIDNPDQIAGDVYQSLAQDGKSTLRV